MYNSFLFPDIAYAFKVQIEIANQQKEIFKWPSEIEPVAIFWELRDYDAPLRVNSLNDCRGSRKYLHHSPYHGTELLGFLLEYHFL